jgi:hypothetical protein
VSTVDEHVVHPVGTPRAAGDSQVDEDAAGPVDDDTDTEGTPREDGDSQPLLDPVSTTDPVVNALTAHDRVLTTTIAGIAEADRALDLAITGIATALDEDDDDATDANTMASLMPVIPVSCPDTHDGGIYAPATIIADTKPCHPHSFGFHGRHQ